MRIFNKIVLATLALASFLTSCQKADFVSREESSLSVDCLAQVIEQNIMAKGAWTIDTRGADWITVSPESGVGNGRDFQMYNIAVDYNKGGAREATIYVCQGDTRCPVTIRQTRCKFAYTGIEMVDSLFQTIESAAGVNVKYDFAAGDEEASLTATLTGAAAEGLSILPLTTQDFRAGSGALYLPILGTPVNKGKFQIEVFVDKKSVGTCEGEVTEYIPPTPVYKAAGLPAKWNFFEAGLSGTAPLSTEMGKYWSLWLDWSAEAPSQKNPNPRVYPTSGNGEAVITAVMAKEPTPVSLSGRDENYTYNPALQVNGILPGDYWLATIPVFHFENDTKISVEAAVSTAAKGAGYYILEYSADGKNWIEAPGATEFTKESTKKDIEPFKAHFWNVKESTTNYPTGTRKNLDKATDPTYHKYVFETAGIEIAEGNFYVRLRVLKYRYDFSADASAAWTDLKCLELDFVE